MLLISRCLGHMHKVHFKVPQMMHSLREAAGKHGSLQSASSGRGVCIMSLASMIAIAAHLNGSYNFSL